MPDEAWREVAERYGAGAGAASRDAPEAAGWSCSRRSSVRPPKGSPPFSWISPLPLWYSRNDRLAAWLGDPTNDRRRAWMKALGAEGAPLIVDERAGEAEVSFVLAGDTGEGDLSQRVVVPPLLARAEGAAFFFICSDVIYPAGGDDQYEQKFFDPYSPFPGPIYAVPGNHDWYDDGTGFMHWLCGATADTPPWPEPGSVKQRVRAKLWRSPPRVDAETDRKLRARRDTPRQRSQQRTPYYAIDAGPLRLVAIDTGISGEIDYAQGEWLREVSKGDRPKVLLTGKPIYVDGDHHPGPIERSSDSVDEVVRDPAHNYIAAIGGDIHNYQRYPITLADGRELMYLVSGGGGAFMHETHTIPHLDSTDLAGVSETEFRCYPLRGDSLSRFSQLYARQLRWVLGPVWRKLYLGPRAAATVLGHWLGIAPTREDSPRRVPLRSWVSAWLMFHLPTRKRGLLHIPFSEWLDWNEPPLFKHFLRVDASADRVTICCFAATGCGEHDADPPLEDALVATRDEHNQWRWSYERSEEPASYWRLWATWRRGPDLVARIARLVASETGSVAIEVSAFGDTERFSSADEFCAGVTGQALSRLTSLVIEGEGNGRTIRVTFVRRTSKVRVGRAGTGEATLGHGVLLELHRTAPAPGRESLARTMNRLSAAVERGRPGITRLRAPRSGYDLPPLAERARAFSFQGTWLFPVTFAVLTTALYVVLVVVLANNPIKLPGASHAGRLAWQDGLVKAVVLVAGALVPIVAHTAARTLFPSVEIAKQTNARRALRYLSSAVSFSAVSGVLLKVASALFT